MKCSLFNDFQHVADNRMIATILESIKDGSLCGDTIKRLRELVSKGASDEAAALKKTLPAFTPAGMFNKKRSNEKLSLYSGIVHLDLDHIPAEDYDRIFKLATACEYTFACFRSASGDGLKIFIKVSSGSPMHEQATKTVSEYYSALLNFTPDPACKDIARLCFGSHDPDLYINPDSAYFDTSATVPLKPIAPAHNEKVVDDNHLESFDHAFVIAAQQAGMKGEYAEGNRNNFIFAMACNCIRLGIPELITTQYMLDNYDLQPQEIKSCVSGAYKRHFEDFAKFATDISEIMEPVDYLGTTPTIPEECYSNLPRLLTKGCDEFSDLRERDVFLTGALTILSGCVPETWGTYDRQTVFPNLFSFIIAPAASGKGTIKFSKSLGEEYHSSVLENSRNAKEAYEIELEEYNISKRNNKDARVGPPPDEPPLRVVYVPANASYAKILTHLNDNKGCGIICETEADTMGAALKQDWGNYSDLLRKSFHHECLSSSKKGNNEFTEIPEPKLSVLLSGTPSQVDKLIQSAEDGLFSRFLFYLFRSKRGWKDVSPTAGSTNLTQHFKAVAHDVHQMVSFLQANPTEVTLSMAQWHELNSVFSKYLEDVQSVSGEESGSIVKRLGLIMYRICMILSAIRKFEDGDTSRIIECSDEDFRVAAMLSSVFLEHSLLMYANLRRNTGFRAFTKGKSDQQLLEKLPHDFQRKEAVEIGVSLKMSSRTVDNCLKKLSENGKIIPLKPGQYRKAS